MLTVLIICLFGISFTFAQQSKPCTPLEQWEGQIYNTNEKRQRTLGAKIAYDFIYRRTRIVEQINKVELDVAFDVLTLYYNKVQFVYNLKYRNCSRLELQTSWEDYGISKDAKSYGEAYIGASDVSGTGVLVTIWSGNYTLSGSSDIISYTATFTSKDCIPVSRTIFSTKHGNVMLSFYDITAGIKDPNVFTPPQECLTDYEWENRFTLFGAPSEKV